MKSYLFFFLPLVGNCFLSYSSCGANSKLPFPSLAGTNTKLGATNSLPSRARVNVSQSAVFDLSSIPNVSSSILLPAQESSPIQHKRTNSTGQSNLMAAVLSGQSRNSIGLSSTRTLDPLSEIMTAMMSSLLNNDVGGVHNLLQSYANAQRYDVLDRLANERDLISWILNVAQEDRAQTVKGVECFKLLDDAAQKMSGFVPMGVQIGYQCLKYVTKGLDTIIRKSSDRIQDVKAGTWANKSGNNVAHLAAKNYSPKLMAWCLVNCVPEVFTKTNSQGYTPYQLAQVKKEVLVQQREAALREKEEKAAHKAEKAAQRAAKKAQKAKRKASKRSGANESVPEPTEPQVSTEEGQSPEAKTVTRYARKIRHIDRVLEMLQEVSKLHPRFEQVAEAKSPLCAEESVPSLSASRVPMATGQENIAHSPSTEDLPRLSLEDSIQMQNREEAQLGGDLLTESRVSLQEALNAIIQNVEQAREGLDGSTWLESVLAVMEDLNETQKFLLEILVERNDAHLGEQTAQALS